MYTQAQTWEGLLSTTTVQYFTVICPRVYETLQRHSRIQLGYMTIVLAVFPLKRCSSWFNYINVLTQTACQINKKSFLLINHTILSLPYLEPERCLIFPLHRTDISSSIDVSQATSHLRVNQDASSILSRQLQICTSIFFLTYPHNVRVWHDPCCWHYQVTTIGLAVGQ